MGKASEAPDTTVEEPTERHRDTDYDVVDEVEDQKLVPDFEADTVDEADEVFEADEQDGEDA